MQKLHVSKHTALLTCLFEQLAPLKKTKIKQILKYGSVRVNGHVVTLHRHELNPGDTLEILSQNDAKFEQYKKQLDFKIIDEDRDVIVVEKPSGLLTMGTELEKEKTLYFMLTEYVRAKEKDGRARISIVHRLDRDASGLVVFAKNEAAKQTLQENWDQAVKKYYAVTEGTPEKSAGILESYLCEDDFKRVFSTSKNAPGAKQAITHYKVLRTGKSYALSEVILETGRKNQIRVHLADLGNPIAGDAKYGAKTTPLNRLALHAFYLSFIHPVTKDLKTYESKLPDSFKKLVSASSPT